MKKADDEGNKDITYKYANLLYKGNHCIKPNLKEAAHYYKIIATKYNDLNVKCIYNFMLINGRHKQFSK